jgi:hypothetical protein
MAKLPRPADSATVKAIYAAYEKAQDDEPRAHLGASVIGTECSRRLWYGLHWAAKQRFTGRMLRLFQTGHLEEARFIEDLRAIGCDVRDRDPSGKQFTFSAVGGHFGGSLDAMVIGVPEASKAWHVAEMKTHNAKSFADLQNKGVEKSKPTHWAQMQVYMRLADVDRALYLARNKDTDELYSERVKLDAVEADKLLERAHQIITAPEPPEGVSRDPAYYLCKMCPFSAVCHGQQLPEANCRTCAHATPELDGDARWSCAKWQADIPEDGQRTGCDEHRWIPALVAGQLELVESDGAAVTWRTATGGEIAQPPWKSSELHRIGVEMATDKGLRELKHGFPDSDVGDPMSKLEIDRLEAEFQMELSQVPF